MAIQSNLVGISYTDFTRIGARSNPFGKCIMLGSALLGTDKTPILVSSIEDFANKFGVTSPSYKHVKSFFLDLTNTGIEFNFYKVNTAAIAATVADYTAAILSIDPIKDAGGIIIATEAYENFPIANRKTIFDALETFCNFNLGSLWIHLVDINPTGAGFTESDVASEKTTNYNSAMSGFAYFGIGERDELNVPVTILPSPSMAAYMLSLWSGANFFRIPSDYARPLKAYTRLKQNFRSVDTMITAGVNPIVLEDSFIYPFSAVSASLKKAFKHINSVVCYKLTAYYLSQSLRSFVNASISSDEDLPSKVKSTLETELFTCYRNRRLLTGITTDDAYNVTLETQTVDVNDSIISVLVAVKPTYTNMRVQLKITNLLGN